VCDLETQLIVLLVTLSEVTPELGRAVLVGVDDPLAKGPELGRDDFEEVLEHVVVLRGLGKEQVSLKGRVLSAVIGERTIHSVLSKGWSMTPIVAIRVFVMIDLRSSYSSSAVNFKWWMV